MKTKVLMMIAAMVVFSFSSCKKDSATSGVIDQPSVNLADDDAVVNVVFEDVFNTADNATIILDQMAKSLDVKSETVLTDSCLQSQLYVRLLTFGPSWLLLIMAHPVRG
jgi:hypothetical protein